MKIFTRLGAVTAGVTTALLAAATLVSAGAASAEDGPVEAGIVVDKVEGLSPDFIRGADISSVIALEESGVVFRDENGDPADLFEVLADHGVNYIRARVWNNPFDAGGNGYGGGNNDVARALEIGQRATAAGMKLLVDFHYADFWAHPGQQPSPKGWVGMSITERTQALHDFTAASLQTLEDGGVDVGMVQIGNETSAGAIAGVTGWANTAQLFQAGSQAVREVLPGALVAVHFTNPENAANYATYAAELDARGVDYDVFASSYYPYWHGSLENLTNVLTDVAETYDKKVMVAEVSWASSLEDGDGHENSIREDNITDDYPATVQGQATAVRDVIAAVADVGEAGIGVFYWEPAWLPVGPPSELDANKLLWEEFGSGWASSYAGEYSTDAGLYYGGSSWENQAMFDYDGNPLESLSVWNYVYTGAVAPLEVIAVEEPTVTVTQGETITLPATVQVDYNDGSSAEVAVTWADVLAWITSPGTYEVNGVTADGDATTATVVIKAVNYLVNGDFETGAMAPWGTSSTDWPSTGWIYASAGNNAQGTYAVNFYDAGAYNFGLNQTVTGLAAGDYTLRGSAHGADITPQLYATTSEGTQTADFSLSGWQNWSTPHLTITVPADGQVTLGAQGSDTATSWVWFDNFELVNAVGDVADTSELEALVDQAGGLNRSVYSPESIATLDAAVEIANIVLAASAPTEQQVADATELVEAGLAGLVIVGEVPDPTVGAVTVNAVEGDTIALPSAVTVTFFDGRHEQQAVTWDDVLAWIDGPGVYLINGETEEGLAATATVTVTELNYLVNGDLETGDLTGWTTTATTWPSTFWYSNDTWSVHGTTAVNIYGGSAYDFALTQAVAELPAGAYALSAQVHGGSDAPVPAHSMVLSGTTSLGATSSPVTVSGWGNWATFSTTFTVPSDGLASVALSGTGGAGDWAFFDDFRLVRVAEAADVSALEAAVAEAEGIERDLYVAGTLPAVDDALAAAYVVFGAAAPSQDTVDAATDQLEDALAALDLIDVAFGTAPVPTIGGTVKVGSTLTANVGAWVPTPSAFAYQWLRNGVAIVGADDATYTVTASDVQKTLTVTVTASKPDYITESKTSAGVTVPLQVFTTAPKPVISGTPVVGSKLAVVVGTWSPKPSAFAYQWKRDGKNISGATGKTYQVKSGDLGHKITVSVTASRPTFASKTTTSASKTIVKRFASTGYASITGTPRAGSTLTAHRGIWSPTPSSYAYQWYRNGVAIDGATSKTYVVKRADREDRISVRVTVRKSGYLTTTVSSSSKVIWAG